IALLPLVAGHQVIAGEKSIKVGVMADMSGFAADIGGQGAVLAARLAAAEVGGKAAGKPIEIVAADMQNKPDVAAEIARRWYDKEEVDAIVDLPVSP
ncbi:ABC transporter substrate-binding protein, partial [Escherichia coli]|uniref:ABC transporter substrate-binding protein n=1 Tax=Escherichia coli TaxID=562 RepID=UPI00278BB6B6